MRSFLLLALVLVAFTFVGCNGCGEPTMTLKSPIAFGTQSLGTPYQTVNVPMAAPQAYVQSSGCAPAPKVQTYASPCAPAATAAPRYVPIN